MTESIWIDARHVKLRSYATASKRGGAIVKLELEVSDPAALGHLLRDCAEFSSTETTPTPRQTRTKAALPRETIGD